MPNKNTGDNSQQMISRSYHSIILYSDILYYDIEHTCSRRIQNTNFRIGISYWKRFYKSHEVETVIQVYFS